MRGGETLPYAPRRRSGTPSYGSALYALLALMLLPLAPCLAAEPKPVWELTPYRVQVLVAFATRPELTSALRADFHARLAERLGGLQDEAWTVRVAAAPAALQTAMLADIEKIAADAIPADAAESDKVVLLAVAWADGYRATAREFDVATQTWSPPVSRSAPQLAKLGDAAAVAVCRAFAPLARFSALEGDRAVLRLRASAIVPRERQPRPIQPGDAFAPFVRSEGEDGQAAAVLTIPRTMCVVEEVRDDGLRCRLESGVRGPLDGHLNGKAQWLALGVAPSPAAKPPAASTNSLETAARSILEKKYKP